MPRIRSTHPDQWTDEDFVELCPWGRLLAIALRNFADDNGVFEWKPKSIKMKIFPADDVDVDALLDALLMQRQVMRFASNDAPGKVFGAIRNFCKYQRPKKPNPLYPITKEVAEWCGCSGEMTLSESHQLPDEFPTGGEKPPQMEEVIGGDKGLGKPKPCPFSDFWGHWPNKVAKQAAEKSWKRLKLDDQREALDAVRNGWFDRWRLSQPTAQPIHATTFLNQERWRDEFPEPQFQTINGGQHGNTPRTDSTLDAIDAAARMRRSPAALGH